MDKNAIIFAKFLEWAGRNGYDTAFTCDSTGTFIVLDQATNDAWKAWCAGYAAAGV